MCALLHHETTEGQHQLQVRFLRTFRDHAGFRLPQGKPPHASRRSHESTCLGFTCKASSDLTRYDANWRWPLKSGSLSHTLSVRCPVCGAKPKERCTLTTGHPSQKTHHDRSLAAAKAGPAENIARTSLRKLKAAGTLGLQILFHRP
jgi:hypothetical protein